LVASVVELAPEIIPVTTALVYYTQATFYEIFYYFYACVVATIISQTLHICQKEYFNMIVLLSMLRK
jgi:hypothetical protein